MQATAQHPTRINVAPPYQLVQGRHGWMLCNLNDFYMGLAISTYGECCEIESKFLLQLAGNGGAVVEVGANMGIHTVPLGKLLALGGRQLLAFEPQPVIYRQLCANLAVNGLTNVSAWPYACGAEAGTVSFPEPDYSKPGNFGGISMRAGQPPENAQAVQVPCVRLDDATGDERIGLIKIDVEGFELNVLKGATATLERWRPLLYVENDRVDESRELIEWLWGAGYNLWWHAPSLFNPDNCFGVAENLYEKVASFNMLGVHREAGTEITGLLPVTDSRFHPLLRNGEMQGDRQ